MTAEQASKSSVLILVFLLLMVISEIYIIHDTSKDYEDIKQQYIDLNAQIKEWNDQASKFNTTIHKHNEIYLSKTDSLCPAMLRLEQHFRANGRYKRME